MAASIPATRTTGDTHRPVSADGEVGRGMSSVWRALDEEVAAREEGMARAGQAISFAGIPLAIVATTIDVTMALGCLAVTLAAFAWFTIRRLLSREALLDRVLRGVSPLFVLLFPFATLALIWRTQGAELALGSWIPPEILIGFIGFSVLRLRPSLPILMGIGAALGYLAFYFLMRATEPAHLTEQSEFFRPGLQVLRAGTFVVVGVVCAVAARGIRKTIGNVSQRARAHDLFGKYRLGAEIASGGMGSVVRATYAPEGGFERPVAIKRIHPHLAQNPRFVTSFRREAELSARLLHPNIVSVLDFGRQGDTYFIAMEYVSGLSLAQLIDRCRLLGRTIAPPLVLEITRQVLDGLHFAHEVATDGDNRPLRVVHRDLSPNNVLVGKAGQVKLLDFGIARALRDHERVQTQHVAGNFAYMSPEQAEGRPFDARADLFAVGCLVWEMLMGRPLFLRPESAATLLAVLHDGIPSVKAARPELRGDWDGFLARALARDPVARFQGAAHMASALDSLFAAEGRPGADDLRTFVSAIRRAKIPDRVASDDAFEAHDAATMPPTPMIASPMIAPPAARSPPPTRGDEEPADTVRVAPARLVGKGEASTVVERDRAAAAVELERQDTLVDPA